MINTPGEDKDFLQSDEQISDMLDRTRGQWADLEGIEEFLPDAPQQWDDEWQQRHNAL